mmetsp:Transcript_16589/g.19961  ORF Transcript_16589/g.19961 Transcript_16589/m.19961 type:complete len:301 (+) Transcript_16589:200-1102(+)|eukprot:CAMPEP_0197851226 /NCGR_PEP_ID=MMETSP1438-20131217/17580_1 /TAXON_ID=1461541 /ORGANISM="Pterosperma sp., Strain CCMP1384" /LENGTH=300 /DNA_ID=CAMNT_0043464755 /DNA_START=200 /DNA_END=1102 /DNA_ORIENTATION=+
MSSEDERDRRGKECCACGGAFVALGFMIGLIITARKSAADLRGDRIVEYNAAVDAWVATGAAAYASKYQDSPLPTVYLTGGGNDQTAAVALQTQTRGQDATGFRDGGDDYKNYDEGFVLTGQTEVPMFLEGEEAPKHFQLHFGNQSYQIEAAKCHKTSKGSKFDGLYFLKEITLVEKSVSPGTEGIEDPLEYQCTYEWDETVKMFTNLGTRMEWCSNGLSKSQTSAVKVVVRAPEDPVVRAGAIIGDCKQEFGTSSGKWTSIAIGLGVGMSLFLCCCCCNLLFLWAGNSEKGGFNPSNNI